MTTLSASPRSHRVAGSNGRACGRFGSCAPLLLLAGLYACGDPAEEAGDVAKSCGQQACPAGTRVVETRSLDASNDISGGYDPVTYKADGAYQRMASGSCEYACEVIQACPAGSFPIITRECMKCAPIEGTTVKPVACSDEGTVAVECGRQECPMGTVVEEKRNVERGYDISMGPGAGYDPENAFQLFGEGKCEYACRVAFPCPAEMFPVIRSDCFTCGLVVDGMVVQGDCG